MSVGSDEGILSITEEQQVQGRNANYNRGIPRMKEEHQMQQLNAKYDGATLSTKVER